jgi:hypothetical protein
MAPARAHGPYVARLDDEGRSIIGVDRLDFGPRPGKIEVAEVWNSARAPVPASHGPVGTPLDVNVRPGGLRSLVTNMHAGYDSGLHRTDTIDFSVVLDGRVNFVVETGEVTLGVGDCVLVCGVLHAWRALHASTIAITMMGVATDGGAR